MSENTQTIENEPKQQAQADGDEGGKTFTQAEVEAIVRKRVARAEKPSDYDELKAKAAKLDELEEANKSELQKLTEERDSLSRQLEERKAADERRKAVADAIAAHELSADDARVLERMSGDVSENAAMLAEIAKSRAKYPNVSDGGENRAKSQKSTSALFADAVNQF